MQMTDLEVFKEIPGYKAILKAVLKSQIQSLVEQLSQQTGEESVIVTASLEDGSLTHLGSDFGKVFLDSHDEIKGQFLGFCLKRNQMMQKSMSHQLKNVRKKGPFGAGRRPRLAPYYTTTSSRKAPRKSTPRNIQSQQQMPLYDQNYTITQEPSQNQTEDFEQGTSNHLHTIVKTEPGLENEMGGEGTYSADNQIYIENVQSAFPYNSYHGDGDADATKFKEEGLSGTHSLMGDENQPRKRRGQGQMKINLNQDDLVITENNPNHLAPETSYKPPINESGNVKGLKGASQATTGMGKKSRRSKRCRKTVVKKDEIASEIFVDSSIRPYPCNQCPKRFKERHHLTYHLRVHSGQRPYTCSVCSKSFTQSSSLNTHKKIHWKETSCGLCGQSFRKKSQYNSHVCSGASLSEFGVETEESQSAFIIEMDTFNLNEEPVALY